MRGFFYFIMSQIKKIKTSITTAEENIETLQEKNYIIAGLSSAPYVSTSSSYGTELITLDTEINSNGNTFTLITTGDDSGKIKIEKNCLIKISANIMSLHPADKIEVLTLQKNGTNIIDLYDSCTSGKWNTTSFSPIVVECEKDDLISICYGADDTGVQIRLANKNHFYVTIEEYK